MSRGVVLGAAREAGRTHVLRLGDAVVEVDTLAFDPLLDEAERLRVARLAAGAEDLGPLLALLSPAAAQALAALDGVTLEAGGLIWVAAVLGAKVATDWRGVLDPGGRPVPLTAEAWQLACFSVEGFAAAWLRSWSSPLTMEAAAGNG